MKNLLATDKIVVPSPKPDQVYRSRYFDHEFAFHGLKRLLGAADCSKAGDRHAGLAASTETEREAARTILSGLTLQHLYDNPLTDDDGKVDSVMVVNYDIDHGAFNKIAALTLGEVKDRLLRVPGEEIQNIGKALTGVMAAALAKLCDVHELICIAAKKITHADAKPGPRLGRPGRLSSRLQPNHPTDDLRGITLLVYWGLSLGTGDALIGLNPAIDTVDHISRCCASRQVAPAHRCATQICVLSHIKTQLGCLERGCRRSKSSFRAWPGPKRPDHRIRRHR